MLKKLFYGSAALTIVLCLCNVRWHWPPMWCITCVYVVMAVLWLYNTTRKYSDGD